MRDFNQADKNKKARRITLKENPGGLAPEKIANLESKVRASLRDNYLPCVVALTIAREESVPAVAVGAAADRLGVRVTDCQIGCFKVDKNIHRKSNAEPADGNILAALVGLKERGELACINVFGLARGLKLPIGKIAGVANSEKLKVGKCQLGCF